MPSGCSIRKYEPDTSAASAHGVVDRERADELALEPCGRLGGRGLGGGRPVSSVIASVVSVVSGGGRLLGGRVGVAAGIVVAPACGQDERDRREGGEQAPLGELVWS